MRIGITLGDCAGIGPEIVDLALKSGQVTESVEYVIIGRQPDCKPGKPTVETARAAAAARDEAVTLARRPVASRFSSISIQKRAANCRRRPKAARGRIRQTRPRRNRNHKTRC